MKRIIFGCLITLFFSTSCATIVSKSQYPVYIASQPVESEVTVKNQQGFVIFQGRTPTEILLPASVGFFKKAAYTIEFNAEGYQTHVVEINSKLDPWYLYGNLIIGWPIGWLILDPATGAMYKIPVEFVNELLVESK